MTLVVDGVLTVLGNSCSFSSRIKRLGLMWRETASGCSLKKELDARWSPNTGEYEEMWVGSFIHAFICEIKRWSDILSNFSSELLYRGRENWNWDLLQLDKKINDLESMFQEATNCRNVCQHALTGWLFWHPWKSICIQIISCLLFLVFVSIMSTVCKMHQYSQCTCLGRISIIFFYTNILHHWVLFKRLFTVPLLVMASLLFHKHRGDFMINCIEL